MAASGTAHRDYVFWVCLDRKGFQAIPDSIYHKDKQMMVVVEGRRPHCWNCKQVSHILKVCHQKAPKEAETTQPEIDATKKTSEAENLPSTEDGWNQVTQRRRKNDTTKKAEDTLRDPKPSTLVPKEPAPVTKNRTTPSPSTVIQKTPSSPISQATQKTPTPALRNIVSPIPKKTQTSKDIPMDVTQNLKKKESGEGNVKKLCPSRTKTTPIPQPQQAQQEESKKIPTQQEFQQSPHTTRILTPHLQFKNNPNSPPN